MSYSVDLEKSAKRHLQAADLLNRPHPNGRPDVAGYLYGIAAECALKQILRGSGVPPLPEAERRNDPYYEHFPRLKTLLRDSLRGRRAGDLRRYAEDDSLMSDWGIEMRYAPGHEVLRHVDRWRQQAHKLVDDMQG